MPLPDESEQAATQIAALLAAFDRNLASYVVNGGRPPNTRQLVARLRTQAERTATAGLRDVGAPVTTRTVNEAAQRVLTPIEDMVAAAVADARRTRRRMPRRVPDEPDTDGTNDDLIRKVGAGAALAILIRRQTARQRTPDLVRQVAREVGLRPPKPTSAYSKMVARTVTAELRNDAAADIVDARNRADVFTPRWAVWVRDGLNGPTDDPCERVDRKWATPVWMRRNKTAHPNCTRRGEPRPLPPGAVITLLE